MLVLTRQTNEAILIGDNIRLTVVAINGSQVRLGIEAPRDVPILRNEVHEAVSAQNEAAAQVSPIALQTILQDHMTASN